MRLLRLTPVLIGLVALHTGCGDTPSGNVIGADGARLFGTWKQDLTGDPKFERMAERSDTDPGLLLEQADEMLLRFTFGDDGTCTMGGSVLGHPIEETWTWRTLENLPDRITVEVTEDGKPPESMTFEFIEPDLVRSTFVTSPPTYLRRVQ